MSQKLHIGCGATVVEGWINIEKSPNVHLARILWARQVLYRARILTAEQASAEFPKSVMRIDVRSDLPFRTALLRSSTHPT